MTETNIGNGTSHPFIRTQEVVASARWLLILRWAAGLGVLIATWVACSVLDLGVSSAPLYVTGFTILVYNAGLWAWLNRLEADDDSPSASYDRLAHLQVGLDWLSMAALIHFSGGIESPIIFFYIFHILISSLLFSQRIAYVYAIMALVLVGGVAALQWLGWLPHVHVEGFLAGESYRTLPYVVGVLGTFGITSLVTVYLTSSIAERLRHREDQLKTLYLAAQTINSSLNFQEVLDRLVRATAGAMNVSGASIGLLDSTGSEIDVVAAYGISQAYLSKGPTLVSKSRVYDKVLSTGEPLILQGDFDPSLFQYPDEKELEGIRSILYVPLVARRRPLGVVRVHSRQANRFNADDARFLSAIGAQGAVAIENALAYQALKKLDVDKSQFVRSVTHELRSPVTGAQSLLRGVLKGYAGNLNDRQREIMGRLNRRLDKLEALINDLLDLAAGRSDLQVEECRPLSLMGNLDRVMTVVEPQAREKDQKLIYERPESSPVVMATEEGLDRILVNLVGNAVKYTPEGGTVTVSVQEHDRQVGITIKDTGIGIPADSLPRLFQEFYRAPNAKAFETGTGLGLVIVKELVESFNGRISVESQEGKGTTFTVHLPVVAGHDQAKREPDKQVETEEELV
jgi:signal transduction histidine kinase